MSNAEQLLYETKKMGRWRFSIKTLFLKILQYLLQNICVKFLKEHLHTAASELTF